MRSHHSFLHMCYQTRPGVGRNFIRTSLTLIITTSLHPIFCNVPLTGWKGGCRAGTHRVAAPGLLFLCRLGMDKRGVPSPRGTGSSGKLQRKDSTVKACVYLLASQPQIRTSEYFPFCERGTCQTKRPRGPAMRRPHIRLKLHVLGKLTELGAARGAEGQGNHQYQYLGFQHT